MKQTMIRARIKLNNIKYPWMEGWFSSKEIKGYRLLKEVIREYEIKTIINK